MKDYRPKSYDGLPAHRAVKTHLPVALRPPQQWFRRVARWDRQMRIEQRRVFAAVTDDSNVTRHRPASASRARISLSFSGARVGASRASTANHRQSVATATSTAPLATSVCATNPRNAGSASCRRPPLGQMSGDYFLKLPVDSRLYDSHEPARFYEPREGSSCTGRPCRKT